MAPSMRSPMTRSSRRKPPSDKPRPGTVPVQVAEGEADATERFSREGFFDESTDGPMILTVPPDADEADLALTQPLPKIDADEYDEDLIRTHELPMADDAWVQEMLESGEQEAPRGRMPSRPGRETTGLFPHPALAPRPAPVPRRTPSSDDLPPPTVREPLDVTDERIREAYREYFALCRELAQAVVGEETFAKRLRGRLTKLAERYPREKIVFRPVVEKGVVRVRVLLARKRG